MGKQKKLVEDMRTNVREKLVLVNDLAGSITKRLQDIQKQVDIVKSEAEGAADNLVKTKSKERMKAKYAGCMKTLESNYNALFLIHADLPDEDGEDDSSSSSSDGENAAEGATAMCSPVATCDRMVGPSDISAISHKPSNDSVLHHCPRYTVETGESVSVPHASPTQGAYPVMDPTPILFPTLYVPPPVAFSQVAPKATSFKAAPPANLPHVATPASSLHVALQTTLPQVVPPATSAQVPLPAASGAVPPPTASPRVALPATLHRIPLADLSPQVASTATSLHVASKDITPTVGPLDNSATEHEPDTALNGAAIGINIPAGEVKTMDRGASPTWASWGKGQATCLNHLSYTPRGVHTCPEDKAGTSHQATRLATSCQVAPPQSTPAVFLPHIPLSATSPQLETTLSSTPMASTGTLVQLALNAISPQVRTISTSPQIVKTDSSQPIVTTATSPQVVTTATSQVVTTTSQVLMTATSPQVVTTATSQAVTATSPQVVTAATSQEVTATSPQIVTATSPQILTATSPQVVMAATSQVTATSPQIVTATSPQVVTATSQVVTPTSPQVVTAATSQRELMTATSPQVVSTAISQEVTIATSTQVATTATSRQEVLTTNSPCVLQTASSPKVLTTPHHLASTATCPRATMTATSSHVTTATSSPLKTRATSPKVTTTISHQMAPTPTTSLSTPVNISDDVPPTADCNVQPYVLEPGKIYCVVVPNFFSPWLLWLPIWSTEFDDFAATMSLEKWESHSPVGQVRVGMYVCAHFTVDNTWYRAIITQVHYAAKREDMKVNVLYIDFGNDEDLFLKDIRPLTKRFMRMPANAIPCALAEVVPLEDGKDWDDREMLVKMMMIITNHETELRAVFTCRPVQNALMWFVDIYIPKAPPVVTGVGATVQDLISINAMIVEQKLARNVSIAEQVQCIRKVGRIKEIIGDPKLRPICAVTKDKRQEGDGKEMNSGSADGADRLKSQDSPSPKPRRSYGPSKRHRSAEQSDSERSFCNKGHSDRPDSDKAHGDRPSRNKAHRERSGSDRSVPTRKHKSHTDEPWSDHQHGRIPPLEVTISAPDLSVKLLMAHIESPRCFFIHIITSQTQLRLDQLRDDLQTYYANANLSTMQRYFRSDQLDIHDACVVQYKVDDAFYRAQVITTADAGSSSSADSRSVEVLYVDYGNREWVSLDDVYPIMGKLLEVPAQAVCCQLDAVEPVRDDMEASTFDCTGGWLRAAIVWFEEHTGYEKCLTGIARFASTQSYSLESPLKLLLMTEPEGAELPTYINVELERLGWARVTELPQYHAGSTLQEESRASPAGCVAVEGEADPSMENWRPMEDDFLSERNSYLVDTEDAGVALTGYKSVGDKTICPHYARGNKCWLGKDCRYQHVQPKAGEMTDKAEALVVLGDANTIALPPTGAWTTVEVATVIDPSHFFIWLPFGSEPKVADPQKSDSLNEFIKLRDKMTTYYDENPFDNADLTVYAEGELVAVQAEDCGWYRAKVLFTNPENATVKVVYLDLGSQHWVDERCVKKMSSSFMHLSFQAVECFLPLVPHGETWTQTAIKVFSEFVDGRPLIANVLESHIPGTMTVELYDTESIEQVSIGDRFVRQEYARRPHPRPKNAMPSKNDPTPPIRIIPG